MLQSRTVSFLAFFSLHRVQTFTFSWTMPKSLLNKDSSFSVSEFSDKPSTCLGWSRASEISFPMSSTVVGLELTALDGLDAGLAYNLETLSLSKKKEMVFKSFNHNLRAYHVQWRNCLFLISVLHTDADDKTNYQDQYTQ